MVSQFRDRIVEVKKVKSRELLDNENNWRVHPLAQRETMTGVLHEVGKADVLLAYYSARHENKLTLFDGHLRKALEAEEEWTVAITDLNDAEADKMLLVLDPLAAMAEMNKARLIELTDRVNTDDLMVRELLRKMELEAQRIGDDDDEDEEGGKKEKTGPDAMELMPFEHYDYVLLMFRNELDWLAAVDTLGLERRADQRKTNKIGLCRVISGKQVIERIRVLEFQTANGAKQTKPAKEELTDENRDTEPQAGAAPRHAHARAVSKRGRDSGRKRNK